MENDEEPIDLMARVIYNRLFESGLTTTVHPWDELSDKTRLEFCITAAKGWDAYWTQRMYLENKPRRAATSAEHSE